LCRGECDADKGWVASGIPDKGGDGSSAGGEKCQTGYKVKCCRDLNAKCKDRTFTSAEGLLMADTTKNGVCYQYGNVIGRDCIYKSNSGGAFDFSGKCVEINT
jgi:hypothetical protein